MQHDPFGKPVSAFPDHALGQKAGQGATGRSAEFGCTDGAVAVRVRGFEALLDNSEVFIFVERLVVVMVGGCKFFAAQTAAQFFEVERAVVVSVE
jgi:hypothetical protein